MGCGNSKNSEQKARDEQVGKLISARNAEMSKEIKLLLLGAGESGKSTLFKQMKILYNNGYSEDECMVYKDIVRSNAIQSMKSLIAATHKLGIPIEQPENRARAAKISAIDQETLLNVGKVFTTELGKELQALWADRGIQEVYTQRSQFQLLDSTAYFFNDIDRISDPNFVPNEQDVLRSRVKTTGIVETEFDFNSFKFRLFDVGGQRNERKKWIHCFEDVTAVIFVTALSEYDQKCYEDDTTPRMRESLVLFDEIVNSRYFAETPIILFLNKLDLFRDKISHIDLKVCFAEYDGGCNFEPAAKYIERQFQALNKIEGRQIYTHLTTATDTNNVKNVFDNVKDILLKNNAAQSSRI